MPNAAPPSVRGPRTTRILVGNVLLVGVAGSTFTDAWGDLGLCPEFETDGDPIETDDVDEALECE